MNTTRRHFLGQLGTLATLPILPTIDLMAAPKPLFFKISLAQWSLHRALLKKETTTLDFPVRARRDFGITAVEYVDQFVKNEPAYLKELLKRSRDEGVVNHLLMIDTAGNLVDGEAAKRADAITRHYAWAEAAKFLGCKTIRVNLQSKDSADEVRKRAIESMGRLAEKIAPLGINVVAENHGGHSSDGSWMASVAKAVGKPNCGLLPDFGNFCQSHDWGSSEKNCDQLYDRYKGVTEMLPYAKGGVSAKSYGFNAQGQETKIDYARMLKLVKASGFNGYIGVEFEGEGMAEDEGIRRTKALLESVGSKLA
ncbi:sugar phosphate isomerase/epimerase family protein [Spirosoma foliorum]|uniref:Sugar phosphate isomerase/epimerase n=1 Tax=Spirosoma foliorum TaxID=2710596 RepID=A0A7G5GZP6_9BACT|nr:sugar phosphate isomerase/epimerase family protein [Spirosoma foliorum]QMW04338.1 sugar phosphate isomerase/epimerase [Spirosoma foliorum]